MRRWRRRFCACLRVGECGRRRVGREFAVAGPGHQWRCRLGCCRRHERILHRPDRWGRWCIVVGEFAPWTALRRRRTAAAVQLHDVGGRSVRVRRRWRRPLRVVDRFVLRLRQCEMGQRKSSDESIVGWRRCIDERRGKGRPRQLRYGRWRRRCTAQWRLLVVEPRERCQWWKRAGVDHLSPRADCHGPRDTEPHLRCHDAVHGVRGRGREQPALHADFCEQFGHLPMVDHRHIGRDDTGRVNRRRGRHCRGLGARRNDRCPRHRHGRYVGARAVEPHHHDGARPAGCGRFRHSCSAEPTARPRDPPGLGVWRFGNRRVRSRHCGAVGLGLFDFGKFQRLRRGVPRARYLCRDRVSRRRLVVPRLCRSAAVHHRDSKAEPSSTLVPQRLSLDLVDR